jgi:SLOG family YspA-like protein
VRILVTGSRTWADAATIRRALHDAARGHNDVTVVHGGADGADVLAHAAAQILGLSREVHRPDWRAHGPAAGFRRNTHMVQLGADLCLVFQAGNTRGTADCAAKARAAGIPTTIYHQRQCTGAVHSGAFGPPERCGNVVGHEGDCTP